MSIIGHKDFLNIHTHKSRLVFGCPKIDFLGAIYKQGDKCSKGGAAIDSIPRFQLHEWQLTFTLEILCIRIKLRSLGTLTLTICVHCQLAV